MPDERLHIYLARGRRVRCISVTPRLIAACCAATVLFAGWLIGATAYIVFNQEIRDASSHYLIERQRAYEDRIASLRRQVDAINSRQFLDQVAFENKLNALRQRQHSLEERQAQVSGLLESVSGRDVTFAIPAAQESEQRAEATPRMETRNATWTPLLVGRPRPAATAATLAKQAGPRDPTTAVLREIDQSLDQLWSAQDSVLHSFETGLARTIEKLTAVPKAIGAPLPRLKDGGVGGPFVAPQDDEEIADVSEQILRIERALDRIEVLERHVRRLPVRTPLKGNARVTSRFGNRVDPFLGRRAMHTGIDFRASTGTPVIATAAGRVSRAGRAGGYGNLVEIDHGDGYATRYAHLSRIDVKRGQSVAPGDVIGAAGSTGRSTGPHLHYETRVNGRAVDPMPFVKAADLLPAGL